jgi:signal transduction histidine kinase/ActR/RegA family two-component response regulator
MCIGRTPAETLEIVLDAVPAALGSVLVHLRMPGTPPVEHAVVRGAVVSEDAARAIGECAAALQLPGAPARVEVTSVGEVWAIGATFAADRGEGRLFVGYAAPQDEETAIVLVRAAANLVGSTLEAARVLEAARRKDEFLAELGHELRNPLAPILTVVELLARNPTVGRERSIIERHTRHLARLVDDLLDISRVTRGNIELRREPVNLGATLERAVELASALVVRHRHRIDVDAAADVTLVGDGVRLVQVFGNLLTNAAKFTPPGGRIEVRVTRDADRVRVAVRDDGRGIARDQLQRIFEPFVQGEKQRDALSGGLGLGLAIVKSLVDRHGGSISVTSGGAGAGSTFTVDLPTIAAPAAEIEAPSRVEAKSRSGLRVLVVDDNIDVAALLSEALELEGFTTAVAHDAPGALEVGRRFMPHAAVLDVGLPGVDGYELAQAIRAEYGRDVALIAATGYGQRRDRERSEAAGFACHLVKPVSVLDLVTVLDAQLGSGGAPADA